jgi:CBS domain-containing protein
MLKITKNQSNPLYVTVTEKTTLDPAYYIMSLYSKDNRDTKVLRFSGDSSTNIERWNIFEVTEVPVADEDLENAKINLLAGGTYDYTIYQTSNFSGTSVQGAGIVERGLLKVSDPSTSASTYSASNNIITFE